MLENRTYKNWKEICAVMGWKTIGGTYKKARIKDLDTLCKYHKSGHSFVIDEIYENKLERKDNRNIYQDDISKLIIHECAISENKVEYSIELSIDTLLLKLSMINNNFRVCRNNMNETSSYLKITIEDLTTYYYKVRNDNKKRLESALNKLQKASYIKWEKIIKINYNGAYRTATNNEIRTILTAERETLDEMKLTSKQELYIKNSFSKFNESVKNKIKDKMSISYYFSVYKIIPSVQFEAIMLEEYEKHDIESNLNHNICLAFEKSKNFSDDAKKFSRICISNEHGIELYDEIKFLSSKPYTNKDKIVEIVMENESIDEESARYLLE